MLGEWLIARIALLASVSGVLMLFLLNAFFVPEKIAIEELNESFIGKKVLIEAKVEKSFVKKNVLIAVLSDGNSLNAVVFSPSEKHLELFRKNSFVEVVGKIHLYKNSLEIVVEEVRQLD